MRPDLWNTDCDELLEIPLLTRVHLTGFADEVTATIVADLIDKAEILTRSRIEAIETWLEEYQLKLTKHETGWVVLPLQRWFPNPFSLLGKRP